MGTEQKSAKVNESKHSKWQIFGTGFSTTRVVAAILPENKDSRDFAHEVMRTVNDTHDAWVNPIDELDLTPANTTVTIDVIGFRIGGVQITEDLVLTNRETNNPSTTSKLRGRPINGYGIVGRKSGRGGRR